MDTIRWPQFHGGMLIAQTSRKSVWRPKNKQTDALQLATKSNISAYVQCSKGCKKIPRTLLGRSMYPHSIAIPRMLKSKKVDKIKGKYQPKPPPTLKVNGTTLIKPKEVATALAEHYASASVKTKNLHRTVHNRAQVKRRRAPFSMRGGHPDNVLLNAPFTSKEMETQLDWCKDSAPGPDDITISMIKHLTTPAKHTLLKALNKLWEVSVYPEQWSKEIKLPFLKPGKDPNLPSSYRPISLTSCICKLFERMVNHRLMWFLEKNNILCPEQSGFRKHRYTIDALTQLTCHIEKGFREKKHTIAVFFDIEKAYDTIWKPEILNYLHEMSLRGNLPAFAEGFLSSQEFCVRVGASHSEYFVQEEGLPQGSVTLFAIAINPLTPNPSAERWASVTKDFSQESQLA